jgi:hypothetical protein
MSESSHRQFIEWLRSELATGRIKARPLESFAHRGALTDSAGNIVTMEELEALYKQRDTDKPDDQARD